MRAFIAFMVVFVSMSSAQASSCRRIFDLNDISADIYAQAAAGYDSMSAEVVRTMDAIRARHRGIDHASNQPIRDAIDALIADEELSVFHTRINETLTEVLNRLPDTSQNPRNTAARGEEFRTAFFEVLWDQLAELMPEAQATRRIEEFENATVASREQAMNFFGGQNFAESLRSLMTGGDSLIARYRDRARTVLGGDVATLQHSFVAGPPSDPERTHRGPARLVVAVDARTAPIVQEVFGYNPHLLFHTHTPNQGTMAMYHYAWNISYAMYNQEGQMQLPVNSIMPAIVLSTTEASRVINYFDLGHLTNHARTKYPWSFLNQTTGETYVAPGAYTCCTHWVGEMPFGDTTASEYGTAGMWEGAGADRRIRLGGPNEYTHFQVPGRGAEAIGRETRIDRLTRLVWKMRQGAQQLWQVLGLRTGMSRSELVNPGWVLYNLVGDANSDRVPVVFFWVQDARQPLTPQQLDNLRNTISTH